MPSIFCKLVVTAAGVWRARNASPCRAQAALARQPLSCGFGLFDPAQRLTELEVQGLAGAEHGERSLSRINQRNGCRDRVRETRAGTVGLRIPKLGKGSDFPGFLEPRRTVKSAPANATRSREWANAHGDDPGSLRAGQGSMRSLPGAICDCCRTGATAGERGGIRPRANR